MRFARSYSLCKYKSESGAAFVGSIAPCIEAKASPPFCARSKNLFVNSGLIHVEPPKDATTS